MSQIDAVKKYKVKKFATSEDVKKYDICTSSGKVAIKGVCPNTRTEYYAKGTQPDKCSYHSGYSSKSNGSTQKSNSETTTASSEKETTAKSDTQSKNNPTAKAGSTNNPTTKASPANNTTTKASSKGSAGSTTKKTN